MSDACRRCGTCCRQGGPALHGPDLALLRSGALSPDILITVRKGELAHPPLGNDPEPVASEFLKLAGQGGTWCCVFYDNLAKGCRRYDCRPMACGLLDCQEPGPLLALAGQDLLTRFDCLDADDPLLPLMREHELSCPCPDLATIKHHLQEPARADTLLAGLEAAVARDLQFREQVASAHRLSLGMELFAFGRPLFQVLSALGIRMRNTPSGLQLALDTAPSPPLPQGISH